MDIHVYIHTDTNTKLDQILQEITNMSGEFDALKAAVEDENTVIDGVITLLGQLSAALLAAKDDPTAIQALADEVNAKKQSLADAVTANTPA